MYGLHCLCRTGSQEGSCSQAGGGGRATGLRCTSSLFAQSRRGASTRSRPRTLRSLSSWGSCRVGLFACPVPQKAYFGACQTVMSHPKCGGRYSAHSILLTCICSCVRCPRDKGGACCLQGPLEVATEDPRLLTSVASRCVSL